MYCRSLLVRHLTPSCTCLPVYPCGCTEANCSRSVEAADTLEIAQIHPYKKCLSDNIFVRDETPVAAIQAIVPVIAHHEVLPLGNSTTESLDIVCAQLVPGEVVRIGNVTRRALIVKDVV